MAHVQDRWWRPKNDPLTGEPVLTPTGKQAREKTELYGKGDRYRVRWDDPQGNEKSRSFPDKQLGKAKKFKTKIENDLLAGSYIDPEAGQILVPEFGDTYQKGRSQDISSRVALDRLFRNQIYAFFEKHSLNAITVNSLRDWLPWMTANGASTNYQYQVWMNLSAMLDAAVAEGKIRLNPCHSKSISPPKQIQRVIRPWPQSKLRKVESGLHPRSKPIIPLGAGLGLRHGEMLAFSLDDIDRGERVYHCRRQLIYRDGQLYFRLPKGHKTRTIPIGSSVLDNLDEYATLFPPTEITLPWAENDGKGTETARLLITRPDDRPWVATTFNHVEWQPAFAKAGVPYTKRYDGLHALRHLFASHMLAEGVTIKELSVYLGHSSEAFTLRVYVHLMPSSYGRARQAVDTLFLPGGGQRRTSRTNAALGSVDPRTACRRPGDRHRTPDCGVSAAQHAYARKRHIINDIF